MLELNQNPISFCAANTVVVTAEEPSQSQSAIEQNTHAKCRDQVTREKLLAKTADIWGFRVNSMQNKEPST